MERRRFLGGAAAVVGGFTAAPLAARAREKMSRPDGSPGTGPRAVTLFLCGDVMIGRGVDQILPHPGKPHLYEPFMRSALGYVEIAERATGPIKRPVGFPYIWGDALAELERVRPDARIINLETAVTAAEDAWPSKGIHYRMHPANVPCLTAANMDCCALANNHVLDWGYRGLAETLDKLRAAGLRTAGAGRDEAEAAGPAVIDVVGKGRVLVFAFGMESAGIAREWAARKDRAGVNFVADLSARSAERIAGQVSVAKRAGDVVVASIHWGGNWGYDVARAQREFAHRLIEIAGVDLVHGHSSHHPKGIEVYRDKAIVYGCGDFLNDYEGIGGYEAFRSDLGLMYFPTVHVPTGKLVGFSLTPTRIRHFRVNRADERDAQWLGDMLNREGRALGTRVERQIGGALGLRWG